MNTRRISQLLIVFAALCGVLAVVCACGASRPGSAVLWTAPGSLSQPEAGAPGFPLGPSMDEWMRENGIPFRDWNPERTGMSSPLDESEFPKLSEP